MPLHHSQTWEWWEIVLCVAILLGLSLLAMVSPKMLVVTCIAMIPTTILYWYYDAVTQGSSHRVSNKELLLAYFGIGILGSILVGVVQLPLSYVIASTILKPDTKAYLEEIQRTEADIENIEDLVIIDRRAKLARKPKYWVAMLLFSYFVPGLTEELLKFFAFPIAKRLILSSDSNTEHAAIPIVIAVTLMYSTLENIGFIYHAAVVQPEPLRRLLTTVCERVVLCFPGHIIPGLLIAANIVIYSRSHDTGLLSFGTILPIVALSIFFHGTFDFALLAASALNGNLGWVHPRSGRIVWVMCGLIFGLIIVSSAVLTLRWTKYGISL